jgi:hypothetical protein
MEVASARARLVDSAADDASAALATIPRSEIEEALRIEGEPPELILDITRYAGEDRQMAETGKVSVFWGREDLEELLRRTEGKSVTLVFDPYELLQAYEADVEAHGLREVAAVIAVAVAAGTAAGVAYAQPAEGTTVGGSSTIEQVRSDAAGAPPGAAIEAVRSAAAATTPVGADIEAVRIAAAQTIAASGPAPVGADIEAVRLAGGAETIAASGPAAVGADIEAVRTAGAETIAASGPTAVGADIEAIRVASAETIADSASTSAIGDIEAVRSAATMSGLTAAESVEAARSSEIAASAASAQGAVDIEAVRSAEAGATRAAADTGGGINISLPSPAVTGALGGAVALLITGAAFAARRQRPIGPA